MFTEHPVENDFWNQARSNVLIAMANADPTGLRDALARRRLVSWLCGAAHRLDTYPQGLSAKVIIAVLKDFETIKESDPEAVALYERYAESAPRIGKVVFS